MLSELLVLRVFLDEVEQFHLQRLDLGLLILQCQLNLFNLLFDEVELLVSQVSVLRSKLVKVELLLLSSCCLHFSLLLVDCHVKDFVEVGNSLQDSCLHNVEHDSVLKLHCKFVSVSLVLTGSLLVVPQDSGISRNDVIKGDRVIFVDKHHLDLVDLSGQNWASIFDLEHLLPQDIEKCNRHLTPSIDINIVFCDERSVIDNTTSV